MASTKTKQEKRQQLGDLLQQEQEPFVLDLYLFERGYFSKNRSKLESTSSRFIGCCNANNSKNYLSRILRTVLNKFTITTSGNEIRTMSNNNSTYYCDHSKREAKFTCVSEKNNNNGHVVSELERESFSSDNNSCVTTVLNSPTSLDQHCDSVVAHTLEGLRLSNMTEEEVYAGRDFQCQFMPKCNQLSPISVLEQSHQSKLEFKTSDEKESQTTCTVRLPSKLVVEDSTKLSASICKLNFESISDNSIKNHGEITDDDDDDPMRVFGSDKSPSQQFVKSKRMLQQTKQLLFDCVREIISEKVEKCHNELFGQDELGNLLMERMKAWDDIEIGNESKAIASTVSGLDIFDSNAREWKNGTDFEKRGICFEIGDSIAEDFIDEIVVEFWQ